jgi:hypothetical protein
VGLAFMFYAESASVSSAAFRDAQSFRGPDMDPELAFAHFLQPLIFDCRDDATGQTSALRGHSFLRNMFGLKYRINSDGSITIDANNNAPFIGPGRLHWTYGGSLSPNPILNGADDFNLVNYTYFAKSMPLFPNDGLLRDPEHFGVRSTAAIGVDNRGTFLSGLNAPYSAPDMNFMALAAVKADGTLLMPSFHRNYNGISLNPSDSSFQYWSKNDVSRPWLKYTTLRPRPGDHPTLQAKAIVGGSDPNAWIPQVQKPGFPFPEDPLGGGDVRNRPASWGGGTRFDGTPDPTNDSVWLYTGSPVQTLPDGRQYVMMFAPLVIDLDGKLNINEAGNIRGQNPQNTKQLAHASNLGFCPSEMNLGQVLTAPSGTAASNSAPEWLNLFPGVTAPGSALLRSYGHYGKNAGPTVPNATTPAVNQATSPVSSPPRLYARLDFDATTGWSLTTGGTLGTTPWTLPGPFQIWPTYPANYETGTSSSNAPAVNELTQHPSLFNGVTAAPSYRVFGAGELNKIYRNGDTNSDAMLSDLWQMLPNNLNWPTPATDPSKANNGATGNGNVRRGNMITTLSNDRVQVGMLSWLYNNQQPGTAGQSPFYLIPNYTLGNPPIVPSGVPLSSAKVTTTPGKIGREYNLDWRGVPPVNTSSITVPNLTFTANSALVNMPSTVSVNVGDTVILSQGANTLTTTITTIVPNVSITLAAVWPNPTTKAGTGTLVDNSKSNYVRFGLNFNFQAYPEPAHAYNSKTGLWEIGPIPSAQYGLFQNAQVQRSGFATQLFQTLVKVTGAYDIFGYSAAAAPPPPQQGERDALRYLAQLAVNIVDFIDSDDYITPFNWGAMGSTDFQAAHGGDPNNTPNGATPGLPWRNEIVYGTEQPKVVLNEVYAQYGNDVPYIAATTGPGAKPATGDPGLSTLPNNPNRHATYYNVDLWTELCNPFLVDNNLTEWGAAMPPVSKTVPPPPAWGHARLFVANSNPALSYSTYRVLVTNKNQKIHAPDNTDGHPDSSTQPILPWFPIKVSTGPNPPPGAILGVVADLGSLPAQKSEFKNNSMLNALNGAFSAPSNLGSNTGFYMIGPPTKTAAGTAITFPYQGQPPSSLPKATVNAQMFRYKYTIPPAPPPPAPQTSLTTPPPAPTLILQRLLCPYLPPNMDPTSLTTTTQPASLYNPYITVDYFELPPTAGSTVVGPPMGPSTGGINQNAIHNGLVNQAGATTPAPVIQRQSFGRAQPYQAQVQLGVVQSGVTPVQGLVAQTVPQQNQPQHTFFYHNVPNAQKGAVAMPSWPANSVPKSPSGYPSFDWLVHLDRNLVSPMELLHVSGYRPHELTQQFTGKMPTFIPGTPPTPAVWTGHQAPWYDNGTRLYRFLEFVQTPARQAGAGARIPGKLNINTIWDFELFMALCDPTSDSPPAVGGKAPLPPWTGHFYASDVKTIWNNLLQSRNPAGNPPVPASAGTPSQFDQPFLPFSAGVTPGPPVGDTQYPTTNYPNGLGVGNTLLRPATPVLNTSSGQFQQPRLFEPQSPLPSLNNPNPSHPYVRFELLNKIYNNMTVRSNCFAVWVTVGFFEVNYVDPTTGRLYFGQEIGRAEGRNIRHRMFAIVDRSVLDGSTTTTAGVPFLPTGNVDQNGRNKPQPLAEQVLNYPPWSNQPLVQATPFNPHAAAFKDLVPFFVVIE